MNYAENAENTIEIDDDAERTDEPIDCLTYAEEVARLFAEENIEAEVESVNEDDDGYREAREDVRRSKKQPWMASNGRLLSKKEITARAATWNVETLERYLIEVEGDRKESLYDDPTELERTIGEDAIETMKELLGTIDTEVLNEKLKEHISKLTAKQQLIINGMFEDRKTERELAEEFGMAKTSVHEVKERAIRQLRKMAGVNPDGAFGKKRVLSVEEMSDKEVAKLLRRERKTPYWALSGDREHYSHSNA